MLQWVCQTDSTGWGATDWQQNQQLRRREPASDEEV